MVQAERHLLDCARYIELSPVRAGLGGMPSTYRWSSYGANASGRSDPAVTPHPLYDALDPSPIRRRSTYWRLFAEPFDDALVDRIRACTEGGWALGDDDFRRRVEASAGRRATPLPCGRPRGRPKGGGGG